MGDLIAAAGGEAGEVAEGSEASLIDSLKARMGKTPQTRLEQVIEYDAERAAGLMKQWLLSAEKAL